MSFELAAQTRAVARLPPFRLAHSHSAGFDCVVAHIHCSSARQSRACMTPSFSAFRLKGPKSSHWIGLSRKSQTGICTQYSVLLSLHCLHLPAAHFHRLGAELLAAMGPILPANFSGACQKRHPQQLQRSVLFVLQRTSCRLISAAGEG